MLFLQQCPATNPCLQDICVVLFVYIGYIYILSIVFVLFFPLSYGKNYSIFSLKSHLIYDFPTILLHPTLVSIVPVFKLEKQSTTLPSFQHAFS